MPRMFLVTQFEGVKHLSVWDISVSVDVKSLAHTIPILKEVGDLDKEVILRVQQLVDLRFLQKQSCCLT